MTQQARQVLYACNQALAELEAGPPQELWKLRWFTAVAALRAVGHVLKNVDQASGNDAMQTAIDNAWGRWQADRSAHPIFWDFIEEERNRVLKEFTFGASQDLIVQVPAARFQINPDGRWTPLNPGATGGWQFTDRIRGGPFEGQVGCDVVRQAIEWWEQQLDQIDQEAAAADP